MPVDPMPPVYVAIEREHLRKLAHLLAEAASTIHAGLQISLAPENHMSQRQRDTLSDADVASMRLIALARRLGEMVTG